MIWDKLPDCILDKIYSKIVYKQSYELLEDIRVCFIIILLNLIIYQLIIYYHI